MIPRENTIKIERYDNDRHRDAVMGLWREMFGYTDARNDPGFAIDKKIVVGDGLFWVALCDGAVVGTVMAGYDGHRGWIYSMAVRSQQQHQGVGSALLLHAEQALAALGCVKINLQIMGGNEAVQAFYLANGFAVENRISMGKQIKENVSKFPG